jgi:hypothetical protein
MKFTTICLALASTFMMAQSTNGQLLKNLFGSGSSEQSKPLGDELSAFGRAVNSSGQQKFKLPSLFKQQNSTSDVLGMGDLSNLIPSPQVPSFSPPNLLNQFNTKSKQMIDRTTDWARVKQQQLKEKTFGRLGQTNPLGFLNGVTAPSAVERAITPDNNRPVQSKLAQPSTTPPKKFEYFAPPKSNQAAQPPIRTASTPDGQPAARF